MSCQHHASAIPPEPDSRGHALLRFMRHERRCWRRVGYWLARFNSEVPAMRCCAWHAQPAKVGSQQAAAVSLLATGRTRD